MVKLKRVASNLTMIEIQKRSGACALALHFSYETCVAFETETSPLTVTENYWGVTTGKHLNMIDTGSKEARARRLKSGDFDAALALAFTDLAGAL